MVAWLWPIIAGVAVVGVIYLLTKGWTRTAAKGGEDRAVRKSLEETAKRERKADEKRAARLPLGPELVARLRRLVRRSERNRRN